MRDLDEELLAREYTEIVFEENCTNAQTLAKSVVEEKMKSILEGELKVLSEKFRTYEAAGEIASRSLKKSLREKVKQTEADNRKKQLSVGRNWIEGGRCCDT